MRLSVCPLILYKGTAWTRSVERPGVLTATESFTLCLCACVCMRVWVPVYWYVHNTWCAPKMHFCVVCVYAAPTVQWVYGTTHNHKQSHALAPRSLLFKGNAMHLHAQAHTHTYRKVGDGPRGMNTLRLCNSSTQRRWSAEAVGEQHPSLSTMIY